MVAGPDTGKKDAAQAKRLASVLYNRAIIHLGMGTVDNALADAEKVRGILSRRVGAHATRAYSCATFR